MADNMDYTNEVSLFTLKGPVAVLYLDGEIVEGEFVAQDAYNIFLNINDEPVMIPRMQVRMIRGLQGQQIETDLVQTDSPQELDGLPKSQVDLPEEIPREMVATKPLPSSMQRTQISLPEEELPVASLPLSPKDELVEDKGNRNGLTVVLGTEENSEKTDIGLQKRISASLTCTGGPHAGEIYHLKDGITTIGRASDNVVVLSEDKEISHHHAIVLKESGKYIVRDQYSLNGTFVNDVLVVGPHYLESGDEILIGLSVLKYELARPRNEEITRRVSRPFK